MGTNLGTHPQSKTKPKKHTRKLDLLTVFLTFSLPSVTYAVPRNSFIIKVETGPGGYRGEGESTYSPSRYSALSYANQNQITISSVCVRRNRDFKASISTKETKERISSSFSDETSSPNAYNSIRVPSIHAQYLSTETDRNQQNLFIAILDALERHLTPKATFLWRLIRRFHRIQEFRMPSKSLRYVNSFCGFLGFCKT